MTSHYKRIGDYVTQIKTKNTDGTISSLKGININKHFMPSVANVNGTDLSTYRVVKKNQFAFNPMHVGRDEVLPIALLEDDEPVIVSPAYVVFEVNDEQELLPAYLMMWCSRSEFDRNAWFMTDNSVRGGFSWDDFCELKLPIPSIEKQREIVREYNVVNDRIALNEQLIQKLEDTAQAIYKQWFVDFEFPISKEYAESIGKPELEGQPYKSSGGEMEYCDKSERHIPLSWQTKPFTQLMDLKGGGTPNTDINEYWDGDIPFFTPKDVTSSFYTLKTLKYITDIGLKQSSTKKYPAGTIFITARGTVGAISIASTEMAMNQSCYAVTPKKTDNSEFIHQHIIHAMKVLKNEAIGGVFGALVTRDFDGCYIFSPVSQVTNNFGLKVRSLYKLILLKQQENDHLISMNNILMSQITKI